MHAKKIPVARGALFEFTVNKVVYNFESVAKDQHFLQVLTNITYTTTCVKVFFREVER